MIYQELITFMTIYYKYGEMDPRIHEDPLFPLVYFSLGVPMNIDILYLLNPSVLPKLLYLLYFSCLRV